MKIALLAWTSLEPPDSGYRVRTRAILDHLPADDLLILAPGPELQGRRHVVLSRPLACRLPLPFNPEVLLFHPAARSRRAALRALEQFQPDLVLCEGLWTFPPAAQYRRRSGTSIVLDANNIESVAALRSGRRTLKSTLLDRIEKNTYPLCDALVACSEEDAGQLQTRFGVEREKIIVLPNGIHPFPTQSSGGVRLREQEGEKVLLFLGKLDYEPNREAVEWILKQLAGALRGLSHPICLAIVGAPPPKVRAESLPDNVRVVTPGLVPQIAPYIESADVCLAPIFSGSGTRIKVLEYLSAGKPVVATAKAVEGLSLEASRHYELMEDVSQVVAAVRRLLENPKRSAEMARRGKAYVEAHFLWKTLVRKFYKEIETLAAK